MSTSTGERSPGTAATSAALRRAAEEAARSVGPDLLAAFRSPMRLGYKRDAHDVVTVHDRAAEERIAEALLTAVPDSTVLGEEGGARGDGRVHWHVDPIDGTSNFARGISFWCVSIGAVVDGAVVAGAVFAPVEDRMFSADADGAYLDGAPVRTAAADDALRATALTTYPSAVDLHADGPAALEEHAGLLRSLGAVRDLGSGALQLAHVAVGWADVTYGLGTNSWDVAAGSFLLTQAGGRYRGFRGGRELEPAAAFTAPDYVGTGAGDYAVVSGAVQRLSAARAR